MQQHTDPSVYGTTQHRIKTSQYSRNARRNSHTTHGLHTRTLQIRGDARPMPTTVGGN